MGHPTEFQLRTALDLFLAGAQLPVKAIETLIAADERAEDLLIEVLRARPIRDDSWAPVWAIVALGERRSMRALPVLFDCVRTGTDLVHEAVEFALLRYREQAVEPIIAFLEENPGLEGRVHLYAALGSARTARAVEYLSARLRLDEDCAGSVAWALAETGDADGLAAVEREARRVGRRDPELAQVLESVRAGEDLSNPLLADWRSHWAFEEEEESEEAGDVELQTETGRDDDDGLDLQPRYFDVRCPACDSQIEYDSREDESRVLKSTRRQPD